MDPDISRWVLEFLLRSSAPDSLLRKALTVLPLSGADSRLKKTLLLRTLHSDLLRASLSETALRILEILVNYRNDAHPVTDSMRHAYSAVAVECTVKYLAASPDDPSGEYIDAVQRIWRGRVAALEAEGRGSELFSDELTQWRNDIEAALSNPTVRERLASLNCRREALNKVRVYLKEEWEMMGPSFLESAAKLSNVKDLCPEGVCRIAFSAKPLREWKGGLQDSMKEKGESVSGADRGDNGNVSGNAGDNGNVSGNAADNGNVSGNAGDNGNVSGNVDDNDNENGNENENDHNCDDDGGASIEGVAVRDENWCKEPLEERVDDLPGQRDKVQKGNSLPRRKRYALRTCQRGVKICDPPEEEPEKSWSKYDPVHSSEVRKVRESLKSCSLELRTLVKDPLPDALLTSEVVRSKLAKKDTNIEPRTENQTEHVDALDPDVSKSIVLFQPHDANLGKKSSVHRSTSNVRRPNLMERRHSAHTFEWDDSIDNLPQGPQPRRKKRKWTSLEEETLRAGVKMFGEGNWASIRSFYSNIFEIRSGVDLKDKWRNMIR